MSFAIQTSTSTGSWMHAPGSDMVFAYIHDDWSKGVKKKMTTAFTDALAMSSKIKAAVKSTSGQKVVNGLYILDQPAMTNAMNSIDGMGQSIANTYNLNGTDTASGINLEVFKPILAGLSGDISPLSSYLDQVMSKVQAQTKNSQITTNFGVVVGLVSLMPVLNVPVTTFVYAHSESALQQFFQKVLCFTNTSQTYNFSYEVVGYNYVKPE